MEEISCDNNLTVGSVESRRSGPLNRRDNSYVWWTVETGNRMARKYGRVSIFAVVYTWEPVAIIRPFSAVEESLDVGTTEVTEVAFALAEAVGISHRNSGGNMLMALLGSGEKYWRSGG